MNAKPVNKWIEVITYVVGIPVILLIAYKFINFLNNYIDLVNPTLHERLQLLLLGLSFFCLGYYALRRGLSGRFSKRNDSHNDEYCAYQKQGYSPSPRATNHIHQGKIDNYKCNHNAKSPEKFPSYIFEISTHIFIPLANIPLRI